MDQLTTVRRNLQSSITLKQRLLADETMISLVAEIADVVVACYEKGGKVFFCGNGGSAADAQHLAAELSGRYYYDRPPLFAEALHVNTSYITAVANDYSYDDIYSRWITAIGHAGDVLIALSTSGNSTNVVKAVEQGNTNGMVTVGFTGETGGKLRGICDYLVAIPATDTPRIQECHMLLGHTICEIVEARLFPR
ncbi:D-sedoheptulose 7-phosphate isomerase [Neolewinella lacunae]|uniref:Phosphoheptose isomerase n=1 Tax=Neolewinella lacunae TaxID=1517758 RepID=A0A923PLI5_9BACT|nr:D-sedoheptulose 7-phosphate isomerase [Neolewinella lacunae]MBC6996287.1 D-sedoheptulose 7-phosphate isomerase [Neolewinella lacunae]MDN3636910.1 D-sedoheptulose 7-phosphate isomerase [Neolewinella lacunae]